MEFQMPSEIRNDFSKVVENVQFLIETLSTKDNLSLSEYLAQQGTINIELVELQTKINRLIAANAIRQIEKSGSLKTDKRYGQAVNGITKILIKMLVETDKIERKHSKGLFFAWERMYKQGKMRKDLINHFKDVSNRLKKIRKRI